MGLRRILGLGKSSSNNDNNDNNNNSKEKPTNSQISTSVNKIHDQRVKREPVTRVVANTSRKRAAGSQPAATTTSARPQTAPNDESPGGLPGVSMDVARTRSGLSMKSLSDFLSGNLSHSRRNSIHSIKSNKSASKSTEPPHPPPPPAARGRSYRSNAKAIPEGTKACRPSAYPKRNVYIDLLDAHEALTNLREPSQHRTHASGKRDYGEDLADRNIVAYLDLNSAEFNYSSYLKPTYKSHLSIGSSSSSTSLVKETKPAVGSVLLGSTMRTYSFSSSAPPTHIPRPLHRKSSQVSLRQGGVPLGVLAQRSPPITDDIPIAMVKEVTFPIQSPLTSTPVVVSAVVATFNAGSITSPNSSTASSPISPKSPSPSLARSGSLQQPISRQQSGPRPVPPSTHSATSRSYLGYRGRDDVGAPKPPLRSILINSSRPRDQFNRSGSSLSQISIEEEPSTRVIITRSTNSSPSLSSPVRPSCTTPRPTTAPRSIRGQALSLSSRRDQPLARNVALPQRRVESSSSSSSSSSSAPSSSKSAVPTHHKQSSNSSVIRSHWQKRWLSSMSSQYTVTPTSPHAKGGSKNGSVSYSSFPTSTPPQSPKDQARGDRGSYIVKGATEKPNLDALVDLTNSVDRDAYVKQLPAIVHEDVTPTVREVREEVITREIHTHEVYHRVLPVIETVILPTKHYVPTADGKGLVEVPASMVPGRTLESGASPNWHIVQTPPQNSSFTARQHTKNPTRPSRIPLPIELGPVVGGRSLLEPVLISKNTYMTKYGYPRTEYFWRHPPVFETAGGETQYIFEGVVRSINSSSAGINTA